MVLYLTQDEVKKVLDMKSAFEAVEDGFREMGNKAIEMPPRVYLHFPKGVLIAMPAYMPKLNAAGTKLVTVHPGNKKDYNLPAVQAKIVINSIENGSPLAIMDGTYVTAVRTGAAGAVGNKVPRTRGRQGGRSLRPRRPGQEPDNGTHARPP